ncbi:MAG: hypothetical protein A6F71_08170 [Cycloclasticus sp. symbiont of Poecilosclerida sp. M]|nr:MAG: hypothetical protein A6F71_08170 [Cycloclasticus sp. symbiont of Poecilosclerida sp. M]
MRPLICKLTLISIFLITSGCANFPEPSKMRGYQVPYPLKTRLLSMDNTQQPILKSGQIVLSESGDSNSFFFALFTERFSPFIHAGVLVLDKGVPYVYEGLGSLPLFVGDNSPSDSISGSITRRPLRRYVEDENYTAIYDLPDNLNRKAVVSFVLEQFNKQTPFDPYMDSTNHEKLYCTEFVSEALKAGGLPPRKLTPYQKNSSISAVHDWLKIRDPSVIQGISLIQLDNHVATLSKLRSQREIQLYIAIREELHRRYTPDQKLGNVFEWTGFHLKFRTAVEKFHTAGLKLHPDDEDLDWETAKSSVQQLASKMLGPFPVAQRANYSDLKINPAFPCTKIADNLTRCLH